MSTTPADTGPISRPITQTPEFTLRAVLTGTILGIIFGASSLTWC